MYNENTDETLTLGELIKAIESHNLTYNDEYKSIEFDFCGAIPASIASWRGVYAELAMGYDEPNPNLTASNSMKFLEELQDCVGEFYEGYKGGGCLAKLDTPVHVSNWGEVGSTGIVGVRDDGWRLIILTQFIS